MQSLSSSQTPMAAAVTPAIPKGGAAQPNTSQLAPASSKAAAVAPEVLSKNQKKKLSQSQSGNDSAEIASKQAAETPAATPAAPTLAVNFEDKSKDGSNAELARENAELKKRVEVLGQQAQKGIEQGQKAVHYVQRLAEFMQKNFQQEVCNEDKTVVPEFQAVMRQHTVTQQQAYKTTMERLDIVVNEINVLLATATSLKDQVLFVKAQEVVAVADKHAVEYPKVNFEAKLAVFEQSLAETTEKVLFLTESNEVKKHLKKLNKMTVISSEERVKLRDDFTAKWNKVCLLSHSLRFDDFYMKKALSFLPQINHFIPTLNDSYDKAVEIRRNNREATTKNWEEYKKSFEAKRDEFLKLDAQMVEMHKQLLTLLEDLKPKEIPTESYTAFAAHNQDVEAKNRASLQEVYSQHDDINKKLARMMVTQWQLACEKLGKLAGEVDHIGTEDAAKAVKYNSFVKAESYAKPSVKYDLTLMPK